MSEYSEWCVAHNCTHGHCPLGCEKPQPASYDDGPSLICGVCYYYDGTLSEIVPCTPADCPDDFERRV
jgi:hypothetical protein